MTTIAPKGVKYTNNPNTVEYQIFPEEYFSGSDVTLYFGDIFLSEISAIEFSLEEKVLPIYGYASRTYDAVSRGNRLIKGSFRIPFIEAGYLSTVLTHVGAQTTETSQAKPTIAYLMGNQTVPDWNADVKETIEELLNKKTNSDMFKGKFPIGPGQYAPHIAEVKRLLKKVVKDDPWGENCDFNKYIKKRFGVDKITVEVCDRMTMDIIKKDRIPDGPVSDFVRLWQLRMTYLMHTGPKDMQRFKETQSGIGEDVDGRPSELMPLYGTGVAETRTAMATKIYLEWMKCPRTLAELTKPENIIDSIRYPGKKVYYKIPAHAFYYMSGGEFPEEPIWFGPNLLEATLKFQKMTGRKETGELNEDDLRALYEAAGESYDRPNPIPVSETKFADYEQEVWGRDFTVDKDRRYQTFFYTDRIQENGVDQQAILKKKGFDIHMTYGPMPEAIIANGKGIPNTFSFNTTVKALRGIQLTSTGQTIMANGQPIEEIYTFIGKDLD